MRIVFMGTPDFAVPSLDILVQNGYNVVGVITAPDRPAGRGQKLMQSAVKQYAVEHGLRVLQPEKLKNEEFLEELRSLQADLQIVVAFRMLPEVVWNMPPRGTFNLHASLLPNYRGAAPINWAVMNGEEKTGATTFFLRHEIDTGAIIKQSEMPIGEHETASEVHDRLMIVGAKLVLETVKAIDADEYSVTEQDMAGDYPKAPKIFRETCEINWNRPVDEVYNHIRGLSPYPAAWTLLDDKTFKIFRARKDKFAHTAQPGIVASDGKTYLRFAVKGGYLFAEEVQLEGKRRMSVEDFLKGYKLAD